MDLLKVLEQDHKELKRLFRRLEMTSERGVKTREKIFSELRLLLDSHSKAEEVVLYDRMKEGGEKSREKAFEGFEEHHVAKILLKELTVLPKDSERWEAKLSVLKENIEHHIEEEQEETFKQARKLFDREELTQMAEEFDTIKAAHQARMGLPVRIAAKIARKLAG